MQQVCVCRQVGLHQLQSLRSADPESLWCNLSERVDSLGGKVVDGAARLWWWLRTNEQVVRAIRRKDCVNMVRILLCHRSLYICSYH